MDSTYDVHNDVYFIDYITKNTLTEQTIDKYAKELNKFCKSINMEFEEFVEACKREQSKVRKENIESTNSENGVEEYYSIKYDVDNPKSLITKSMNAYLKYCENRNNKNITINGNMNLIRGFLNFYNVELPKWTPLEDDSADWYLLEKEDINFVMKDCILTHQALITFMVSSGLRIGDCLKLTIGDFMNATSDYHDFIDVNDFIDNAPEDMFGYWDFNPKKTKKFKINCKTFNSPESSNYILQSLRRIKQEYFPRKSRQIKEKLTFSKSDALFGSSHAMYKKPMKEKTIADQFALKSKKLHEWRVSKLKKAIANGEIDKEDFDKKVSEIPRFHAHACRKYFETMVQRNCSNIRLCALIEGHKPPLKTDKSYIQLTKDDVQEVYMDKLVEDVTLEKVDTKILSNKYTEELLSEIDSLKSELNETKRITNGISDKYIMQMWQTIKSHAQKNDLFKNLKEGLVLCQYALDFAVKDIFNFKDDNEYLKDLFLKAKAVNEFNPEEFDKKYEEAMSHRRFGTMESMELADKVRIIMISSSQYEYMDKFVKQNYNLVKDNLIEYLVDNNISYEDLDDTDKRKKILSDVIMDM